MKYFITSVFQKISEHETRDCHNKALEKAKYFVMTFEDPSYSKKWVKRGNFIARINAFAKLDPILTDHLKNEAKMTSLKMQNDKIALPSGVKKEENKGGLY